MRFHQWPRETLRKEDEIKFADDTMRRVLHGKWVADVRPYYKCFPSIMRQLGKISLDITLSDAMIEPRVCLLRFAEGQEFRSGLLFVPCILTRYMEWEGIPGDKRGVLIVETAICDGQQFASFIRWYREMDGLSLSEDTERLINESDHSMDEMPRFINKEDSESCYNFSLRSALTVHLLANDPSIITPDVLGKDRERYEHEVDEEWKQRAVERARRRGTVGWNIGAEYEVCPHYRRPHLGLRYTGKGRSIPRIVPIKGSVVHRSKLTEVPTGYILPDGREVEP